MKTIILWTLTLILLVIWIDAFKKDTDINNVNFITIYTNQDIYFVDFNKLQISTESCSFVYQFKDIHEVTEFIENRTATDINQIN